MKDKEEIFFAGIDPGLRGAISVIDRMGQIIQKHIMPVKESKYDIPKLIKIFKGLPKNTYIVIEEAYVRPISGKRACFMNGFGYGILQGTLQALDLEYTIVRPQDWMKVILGDYRGTSDKPSILWCQHRYPEEDLRGTPRSKIPHDGVCDSICISWLSLRKNSIFYE